VKFYILLGSTFGIWSLPDNVHIFSLSTANPSPKQPGSRTLFGCRLTYSNMVSIYKQIKILELHQAKLVIKTNNSVALVRERTIATKRMPLVGEVSANFCG
jgi:hypothetical protein